MHNISAFAVALSPHFPMKFNKIFIFLPAFFVPASLSDSGVHTASLREMKNNFIFGFENFFFLVFLRQHMDAMVCG